MDRSINDIIDSARKVGLEIEGKNSADNLHAKPSLGSIREVISSEKISNITDPVTGRISYMESINEELVTAGGLPVSRNNDSI